MAVAALGIKLGEENSFINCRENSKTYPSVSLRSSVLCRVIKLFAKETFPIANNKHSFAHCSLNIYFVPFELIIEKLLFNSPNEGLVLKYE